MAEVLTERNVFGKLETKDHHNIDFLSLFRADDVDVYYSIFSRAFAIGIFSNYVDLVRLILKQNYYLSWMDA